MHIRESWWPNLYAVVCFEHRDIGFRPTNRLLQFSQDRTTPESSITPPSGGAQATNTAHVQAPVTVASITPQANDVCKRATVDTMDATEIQVKTYVKYDLFPKRKFIINASELEYSQDENSIARQCLRACNMEGVVGEDKWWEKWKRTVGKELNERRNHCQNYLKNEFMGKSGYMWGLYY